MLGQRDCSHIRNGVKSRLALISNFISLWIFCPLELEIRVCVQEHSRETDLLGLVSAILGSNFYWWINHVDAILVVGCMMMKWHRRLHQRNPGIDRSQFFFT